MVDWSFDRSTRLRGSNINLTRTLPASTLDNAPSLLLSVHGVDLPMLF